MNEKGPEPDPLVIEQPIIEINATTEMAMETPPPEETTEIHPLSGVVVVIGLATLAFTGAALGWGKADKVYKRHQAERAKVRKRMEEDGASQEEISKVEDKMSTQAARIMKAELEKDDD